MTELWYYKQYNKLIDKCIQMESEGYPEDVYTEVHHILPKCMGGTNKKNNLVRMPIRYHIFAHIFLMKAFSDNSKLSYAAKRMLSTNKDQSRKFELSKISIRLISLIGEEVMINTKGKNPFKGKHHSEEVKMKMSNSHKNVFPSKETREKQSKAKLGTKNTFYGKHHSEETKKIISEKNSGPNNPNFGKSLPKETRDKISKSKLGKKRAPFSKECRENMSKSKLGGKNNKARKIIDPDGRVFDTVKEAAHFHNICTDTLRDWCRRKPEKGFRYLN